MKLLTAIAIALPFVSSEKVLETNPQGCIDPDEYDADTDYFPEKFVPHETTDLVTVEYHNSYKIVTNLHQNKTYLLYQCGTEPPADEVESGGHHLVLSVPHTGGVAITETPQIPPMELLAKRGDIKAYIGNPGLVSSPCMNHMMDDGDDLSIETVYIPEETYGGELTDQATFDYIEANPEIIVFAGPTGKKDADRHMAIAASQERTAVATFDWLGMYAALYNIEGMANEIIADTESRYKCSAENAATILSSDASDETPAKKPKILWAQFFSGIGWSVAECPTWDSAYYCEYAHHCGAELMSRPEDMGFSQSYGGPAVYWYLNDTDFLEFGKDAETWIYPSKTFENVYNEKSEILDQFKSVQNKNVYDTQGQGPHGWHEQRLAEYDVVALDMCTLVGTNNPNSFHQRRWFRSYFDEPMGSPGVCDAPNELDMAYVPAQAECTLLLADSAATTEPDTTEPDTTEPDATEPDTTEPETTEPDTTEPDTTEPDTAIESDENAAMAYNTGGALTILACFVATLLN